MGSCITRQYKPGTKTTEKGEIRGGRPLKENLKTLKEFSIKKLNSIKIKNAPIVNFSNNPMHKEELTEVRFNWSYKSFILLFGWLLILLINNNNISDKIFYIKNVVFLCINLLEKDKN